MNKKEKIIVLICFIIVIITTIIAISADEPMQFNKINRAIENSVNIKV